MSYPVDLKPMFDRIIKAHAKAAIGVTTFDGLLKVQVFKDNEKQLFEHDNSQDMVTELEKYLEESTISKTETV